MPNSLVTVFTTAWHYSLFGQTVSSYFTKVRFNFVSHLCLDHLSVLFPSGSPTESLLLLPLFYAHSPKHLVLKHIGYVLLFIWVFSMQLVWSVDNKRTSSKLRLISLIRKICVLICIGRSDVEQRIDSHCLSVRRLVTLSKQQHVRRYASARHTCCKRLCFAQDLPVASRRVSAGGVPISSMTSLSVLNTH
jgi:hypothetical protein